jgi:carboxypeptidase C (cathepsin A)
MIVLTIGLLSLTVTPQAASDEVTFLPGWTGALPSKHYSGYLPVGNASGSPGMLHYWLQESEGDPATDPVIMWINGGPGASGMIGMLTELGQLQTMPSPGDPAAQPASPSSPSATPTLYYNKFGWTKVGSLFTIEQPKGVGFSYCTGKGKCVNTDESTAQDTYEALVAFFERFPALKSRPFYVTGESYAGTYLPMLMDQIDLRGGLPNFVGAAIGNGCWGSECFYGVTESQIDYHTFAGQMFISPALTEQVGDACEGRWEQVTSTEGACGGAGVDKCPRALQQMCTEVRGTNVGP